MFRSASGPGLSISTSTANAFNSQATAPPQSGGQQGKSLFGNSAPAQSQPSSSLFGASKPSMTGNQQSNQSNPGTNTTQAQSGGLFGSQQQNRFTATNLNGPQTQGPQAQAQQGGGLFGSVLGQGQNTQNNTMPGGSTFGQSTNNLFGPSQTVNPMQAANAPRTIPSLFSTTIGQQSQQQTVPGVRISVNELRPTTRFNDLHEELQKSIEMVDAFIMNKIKWQEQCEAVSSTLEDLSQQLPPDIAHCTRSRDVVQQALENDAESIASAKLINQQQAGDAKLSFKVINNLKLPQQFHQAYLWNTISLPGQAGPQYHDDEPEEGTSRTLIEYFSKQTDDLSKSLQAYKQNLAEIETYLKGVEVNTLQHVQQLNSDKANDRGPRSADEQIRELASVLRVFENGILGVATKVGNSRDVAQEVMLGPDNKNANSFPRQYRTPF